MRILVEIPTKDRDAVLGKTLAALHNQSFRDFDVLILNDGLKAVGRANITKFFLAELRAERSVIVEGGSRISQAHNHNIALYDERFRHYPYILRLDDDILLNRRALEYMVRDVAEFVDVHAVGGLWFENEYVDEQWHDRATMTWPPEADPGTDGRVDLVNNNMQQRMYHPTDELQRVEHIYSAALYDTEAMRRAGGWPEVYSKGVAHGEETDGTYRLHLSGKRLFIDPRVTGQHLKSPGGIRTTSDVSLAQYTDNMKWRERLPKLREIDWKPTIAVWCQHSWGLGGAQKLFYRTVSLLQSHAGLKVHPVFLQEHLSPGECQEAFGFSYEKHTLLDEYDVCLVLAHQPFKPIRAKHYILYTFFPDDTQNDFEDFGAIWGISQYTSRWIREKWGYEADCIYPVVDPIGTDDVEKENIILAVCRADPHKAPLWMMERFVEMDFPDWEFHLVMASSLGIYSTYEEQVREFALGYERLFLHEDVSHDDLNELYRRARILWSANGLYAKDNPKLAEHFGLTPVEAMTAGCIPVVFDLGGHRETVIPSLRWSTIEELRTSTEYAMRLGGIEPELNAPWAEYQPQHYVQQWIDEIYRVNALAVELEKIERISVKSPKIRVAMLCDSPYLPEYDMGLTTGFGIVGGQVLRGFLGQEDFEIFVFGILDAKMPKQNLPYQFYKMPRNDLQGRGALPDFLEWAKPDVIWTLYDPGNVWGQIQVMHTSGVDVPVIAYFPIEGGGRIARPVVDIVNVAAYPVTYCHAGKELIAQFMPADKVRILPHGADHGNFAPLPVDEREKLREIVGWSDKFVICNVSSNKRVKQLPLLIETMKILLETGLGSDVLMYLHTQSFAKHVMGGWGLDWLIAHDEQVTGLPLSDHILFPQMLDKWRGPDYSLEKLDVWKMSKPPEPKMRGAIFEALDYNTRLGLADLYVDVSAAEGWGLCSLESVACGVPAVTVDDGMVRSEIHRRYCHMLSPIYREDVWHVGTKLCHVDPLDVADFIVMYRDALPFGDPIEMSKRVLEDLPWKPTVDAFIGMVRDAVSGKT